jgi:hypothetical protein
MQRFLFNGSLLFIFLLPIIIHYENIFSPFEFPKFCFSIFAVTALFLVYLSSILRNPFIEFKVSRPFLILSLLLVSCLLSYFVSVNPYLSFWGDSQLPADSVIATVVFFIFSFILLQIIDSSQRMKALKLTLIAVAAVQVTACLIEIFNLGIPWWALHLAVFGTQGQTVGGASLLGALSPFLCISFFNQKNKPLENFLFGLLLFFLNF